MSTPVLHAASEQHPPGRDVLFALGMAAVSLAAAVSSYSGLASLADLAGWNHRLGLLLPVTIDAYAMTATRVWLSPKTAGVRARRWAKGNAIGAIATSVAGNAVAHAANAHVFHVSWPIVVTVSAIPSIVLGLITHLWHLRNTPDPASILDAESDGVTDGPSVTPPVTDTPALSAEPVTAMSPVPQPSANRRPTGRPRTGQTTAKKVVSLAERYPAATITELAKRAGVSESTVRRALRPHAATADTAPASAAEMAGAAS